jgi:hypothetical protein
MSSLVTWKYKPVARDFSIVIGYRRGRGKEGWKYMCPSR